jgi:hypothetical protein
MLRVCDQASMKRENWRKSIWRREMRLRFLGTDSEQGTCPAVYETDRGTFVVQGRLIDDFEALGDTVSRAPDEALVEIPKGLVRFFPLPE